MTFDKFTDDRYSKDSNLPMRETKMHDVVTILHTKPRVMFDANNLDHIKIVHEAFDSNTNTFKWGPNGCPFFAEGNMSIRDTIAMHMFKNIKNFIPKTKKK